MDSLMGIVGMIFGISVYTLRLFVYEYVTHCISGYYYIYSTEYLV